MKTAPVSNGANGQTVSLPADVRIEGERVFVKQIGDSIVLIPTEVNPWRSFVANLEMFSDDFMEQGR